MTAAPLIMVVDRQQRNVELLQELIDRIGYRSCFATDLEMFDRNLEANPDVKLVMVDLAGFSRDIWHRCEYLREREIPFLVISPSQSAAIHQQSLAIGARGVLIKPLVMRELVMLIQSLVRNNS